MEGYVPSFFDGLSEADLAQVRSELTRHTFSTGEVLVAQGDTPHRVFIVEAGVADVYFADRHGDEVLIGHVEAGSTFGEMSLLTGGQASATVKAATELEALILTAPQFAQLSARFPVIYANLGGILSHRLAQSNRRSVHGRRGRVTVLVDDGAPAGLVYGLACSLAWHLRGPTLLLTLFDDAAPPELEELANDQAALHRRFLIEAVLAGRSDVKPAPRAEVVWSHPEGPFIRPNITERLNELGRVYEHILVHVRPDRVPQSLSARQVLVVGRQAHPPQEQTHEGALTAIRGWSGLSGLGRPDRSGVLHVPELSDADRVELASGTLSPSSAAGRMLAFAARDLAQLKVGIAFGAGSIWGYAHAGVLRTLERAGMPIDYVAGTSVGAAVGAVYSAFRSVEMVPEILDRVGATLFRFTVPTRSILSNRGLQEGAKAIAHDRLIEDMPIPYACVAADIMTGREVAFRSGLLWKPLVGSMSIPGVYPPMRVGPHRLVDGGVLNPVPTSVVTEMGADVVVAVKLASDQEYAEPGPNSLLTVLMRSIEMMQSKIVYDSAAKATILIEPEVRNLSGFALRKFSTGRQFIEGGEAAAEAAMPRLAAALPWLRPPAPTRVPEVASSVDEPSSAPASNTAKSTLVGSTDL